jgi:hypothetical protein
LGGVAIGVEVIVPDSVGLDSSCWPSTFATVSSFDFVISASNSFVACKNPQPGTQILDIILQTMNKFKDKPPHLMSEERTQPQTELTMLIDDDNLAAQTLKEKICLVSRRLAL